MRIHLVRTPFGIVALTVLFIGAAAVPAAAATPATGSATTLSTLASIGLGTERISIGIDRATSSVGQSRSALASLDFLAAGTTTIGGSRTATSPAESGSLALGSGPRTLPGLAGVTLAGGSLDASVADEQVRSAVSITMADLDLAAGLVTAETGYSSTISTVTKQSSEVARTLRLGTVRALSVRALLERIGVDPTSLACAGAEAAGAELGVDTSLACETMQLATTGISDADLELDAALLILTSDLATVQATVAGITLVLQPLVDLAATYGIDLSGLLGLLLDPASRDALVAEITRRMDAVNVGLADLAGGTCGDAATALDGVQTEIPSMAATLAPIAVAIDLACDALGMILDALLDVSVITLDGVRVDLTARAVPSTPSADASGSIGSVGVGNRVLTVAQVTSVSDTLAPTVASLKTEASEALTALGIGTFPEPEITLLDVSKSAGPASGGSWTASAEVTGARVRIPAIPIVAPSGPTLGVLGPSAPVPPVPLAETPEVVVEAAVFSGAAVYRAATGDITGISGGDELPNTGVPAAAAIAAGLMLLGAAFGLRRLLIDAG